MFSTIHEWLSRLGEPPRKRRAMPRELVHYWINPDRETGRAAWMRAQLDSAGVAQRRVRAHTPDDLPPIALPARHEASKLQIACVASHFAALEAALADGHEAFVVMEDDMTLPFEVDFGRLLAT